MNNTPEDSALAGNEPVVPAPGDSQTTLGVDNNNNTDVVTTNTEVSSPILGEQEPDAQIQEDETPTPVVPNEINAVSSENTPSPLTMEKSPTRKRRRSISASPSSASNPDVTKKIKKLETAVKMLTRKVSLIEHTMPKCLPTRRRKISRKPRTLP